MLRLHAPRSDRRPLIIWALLHQTNDKGRQGDVLVNGPNSVRASGCKWKLITERGWEWHPTKKAAAVAAASARNHDVLDIHRASFTESSASTSRLRTQTYSPAGLGCTIIVTLESAVFWLLTARRGALSLQCVVVENDSNLRLRMWLQHRTFGSTWIDWRRMHLYLVRKVEKLKSSEKRCDGDLADGVGVSGFWSSSVSFSTTCVAMRCGATSEIGYGGLKREAKKGARRWDIDRWLSLIFLTNGCKKALESTFFCSIDILILKFKIHFESDPNLSVHSIRSSHKSRLKSLRSIELVQNRFSPAK